MWGKVNGKWLCDERDVNEAFDGEFCCCTEVDILESDVWLLPMVVGVVTTEDVNGLAMLGAEVVMEEEEEKDVQAVGSWFRALVNATKDVSKGCEDRWMLSDSKGVVNVGDDDTVSDDVVIPIKVVVTIVSISGDESAVSVVYVGVCVDKVVGVVVPPPVDNFFSNLLWLSPGADDEPPRHGKQQRNSVTHNNTTRFHDYFRFFYS
jgi:hypothetical protein